MSKFRKNIVAVISALVVMLVMALPSQAVVVPGATLNFVADEDTPGNNVWTNNGSDPSYSFTFTNGSQSPVPVNDGSVTFASAYDFNMARATGGNFSGVGTGNPTNADATWELWFSADTVTPGSAAVLYESGGQGDGMIVYLDGNTLNFVLKDGTERIIAQAFVPTGEFVNVIGSYDRDNPGDTDTLNLFINGSLADSVSGLNIEDWSGGDAVGLGRENATIALEDNSAAANDITPAGGVIDFDGQIGIFRFYEFAFDASQAAQNFAAVSTVPEPASALLLLGGFAAFARRRRA